MSDPHGWNSWDAFLAIHDSHLRHYDHFILDSTLNFTPTTTTIYWSGVLSCTHNIEIYVSMRQESYFRGRQRFVRTVEYSYHVLRRAGAEVYNLFRYDNIHVQPGHTSRHHLHRFDDSGHEIEPPLQVGDEGWPHLSDVIEQAYQWTLGHPEGPARE